MSAPVKLVRMYLALNSLNFEHVNPAAMLCLYHTFLNSAVCAAVPAFRARCCIRSHARNKEFTAYTTLDCSPDCAIRHLTQARLTIATEQLYHVRAIQLCQTANPQTRTSFVLLTLPLHGVILLRGRAVDAYTKQCMYCSCCKYPLCAHAAWPEPSAGQTLSTCTQLAKFQPSVAVQKKRKCPCKQLFNRLVRRFQHVFRNKPQQEFECTTECDSSLFAPAGSPCNNIPHQRRQYAKSKFSIFENFFFRETVVGACPK